MPTRPIILISVLLSATWTLATDPDPVSAHSDQMRWVVEHQLRFVSNKADGSFLARNPFVGVTALVDGQGFSITQADDPEAHTGFLLLGAGRNELVRWVPIDMYNCDHELLWHGPHFDVQYLHGEEGLRQNFLLDERPLGEGPVRVSMALEGTLHPALGQDGMLLLSDAVGVARMRYHDLQAWDACGTVLPAKLELSHDAGLHVLQIVVDDAAAVYPIVIDPISTTANQLLTGTQSDMEYGYSVASAGDLNGDGFSDVVIGAWQANFGYTNGGAAYIFYGGPLGIGAAADVFIPGTQNQAQLGISVSTAGDVNGDGFSDLIIGANNWLGGGGAFIYHGSATGISTTADLVLVTPNATDKFGSWVATAGDINADGYSDVLIGAYLANYGQFQEGAVFVYLGGPTGLNTTWTHRLERNQASAHFGRSVASAGDVNGDGYSDVIIGAPRYNFTATNEGGAFLYLGGPNALGTGNNPAPSQTFAGTGNASAQYGWSVACAGDLNGDGYSDVAVGAYQDQIGSQTNEGLTFVYHGGPGGLTATPHIILESNQANAWMGRCVSTAGDVNGDGYADLLVGVARYTSQAAYQFEGSVFLYLGGPGGITSNQPFHRFRIFEAGAIFGEAVATAGDVNGDGYSDMIFGAKFFGNGGAAAVHHGGPYNMSLTPALVRNSGVAGARLGSAVANAGDINGDGFSDLIVGAPEWTNGQANEGAVQVHYGSASGLNNLPDITLESNVTNARFGSAVASAGDVNGDGYADVLVGAPTQGTGGRAYLYLGGPGGMATTPALMVNGPAGAQLGASVSTAGDVNGDGFADFLFGAPGIGSTYLYMGGAVVPGAVPEMVLSEGAPAGGFGHAVATAGDVNGDGFSDVIIGAPFMSNGQPAEGLAFVYYGTELGLDPVFARRLEVDQAGARFGWSVSGAGDTSGSGYSDVIVGADQWESGEAGEGGAFVYRGQATGLTPAPVILQRNIVGGRFGTSVAEAGDMNGDGYADVVVGCPYCAIGGEMDEGVAYVYRGRNNGIANTLFDALQSNSDDALLGFSVSGGGDVDGDGYSDVIAGAPGRSPDFANEGGFHWFRGNRGQAMTRNTRQYQSDLVSPLATNSSDFPNPFFFGIGQLSRSSTMRTLGRLRWEVVHEGEPFSTGNVITNSVQHTDMSATWTDLGANGVELKELVEKLPDFKRHKWRVRVEYHPSRMIDGQRFSRWFYGYASGIGDIGVLPVELLDFSGRTDGRANRLEWLTASESDASHFVVERSRDGTAFHPIGTMPAVGNSQQTVAYDLLDNDPPQGVSFYRLRMVDIDGRAERSKVIGIQRSGGVPLLHPNPVASQAWLTLPPGETPVSISVVDDLGRTQRQLFPGDTGREGATLQLPVEGLASGHYVLVLHDAQGQPTERIPFIKL